MPFTADHLPTDLQRIERLKDEVSGKRKRVDASSGPKDEDSDKSRRAKERDRQIRGEIDRHNVNSKVTGHFPEHLLTVFIPGILSSGLTT